MPGGPWTKNRGYERIFQTKTTIKNVGKGVGEKEEKKNERKGGRKKKRWGGLRVDELGYDIQNTNYGIEQVYPWLLAVPNLARNATYPAD